jgi:hypothetical protein
LDNLNNGHSQFVETWEKQAAKGLTPTQHLELLGLGIKAVQNRASLTLSHVTMLVVLDRILQESQENFPILGNMTLTSNTFKFEDHLNLDTEKRNDYMKALRFLLNELLNVLGRITADILTIPLHNELIKVQWNEPEKK